MIERYDLREDFVCQTFMGSTEAHGSPYYAHLGNKKLYRDLRAIYWWANIKREIAKYVEECLTC